MKYLSVALLCCLTAVLDASTSVGQPSGSLASPDGQTLSDRGLQKLLGWDVDLTISGRMKVILKGGERAFLFHISADVSRAEGESQLVLYRPKLRKARKIGQDVEVKVIDLDGRHYSELEFHYMSVTQGIFTNKICVVILDGWEAKNLVCSRGAESNDGFYEPDDPNYKTETVNYAYVDINGDGIKDVIETFSTSRRKQVDTRTFIYDGTQMHRR